jgi:hypothetical protein
MSDRIIIATDKWAVASDGLQWMLMQRQTRKSGPFWQPLSFVRSTKDILARCMREKGVAADAAEKLLAGLPETFDQWKNASSPLQSPLRTL